MLETPMTLSIPGYQILDLLEDGLYYRLHCDVRLVDQTAVTLKILDPNQVDLVSPWARFRPLFWVRTIDRAS